MSGTRSPSLKAPATDRSQALIVAHGQPSSPAEAEAALARLAARVQAFSPKITIASATMAAPGMLERAVEKLQEGTPVYPLFMADGWFVKTALMERLKATPVDVLAPLGLDPRLPEIAANRVSETARKAGWAIADTNILLAAHGSAKGKAAARSARLFGDRLAQKLQPAGVAIGFIEEEPYLADAARLPARSICVPFFAMQGNHMRDDVPEALSKAGFSGPVLPPFCRYDDVARLIAERVCSALHEGSLA